jgi:hypothetical protein
MKSQSIIRRKSCLILLTVLLILINPLAMAQTLTGVRSAKYLQDIRTEIKLPPEAGNYVLRLFKTTDCTVAVTKNGIFRNSGGKWTSKHVIDDIRTAAIDQAGRIWMASQSSVMNDGEVMIYNLPADLSRDTITCLCSTESNKLFVGTNAGLLEFDGSWTPVQFASGIRINSILKDRSGNIWVATNDGLLRYSDNKWINLDDNVMAYGLKRTYFALENEGKNQGVLFGGLFALGCIEENGSHWLLRGADGLPYGPLRLIRSAGEAIWIGTDKGAIKKDKKWQYYNGRRWLPDNKVNDILTVDDSTTWIATPAGISQISQERMTLAHKAEVFEQRIRERHIRYGLVGSASLKVSGDLSTSFTGTDDNDGLWTSIYLAAECFRYAVTKDPEAKKNAIGAFEAMERLESVTGIPGFPARSFVAANESTGKGGEWHLTADGKWKWKGDTSSDEIVGHMFAYPIFYDLVADGAYKERVKNLVSRIMTHIVSHNYLLVDLDGKPTRWGVWNPDSLNGSTEWSYERGINSLQMLSFLKAAYHVTGDQKFENSYQYLISEQHYDKNMIQTKMYGPFDVNHSDDELAFLPYYTLFRYVKETDPVAVFRKSIQRSWEVEKADRIPVWNIIATTALGKDCGLPVALEELELIPMDLITWKMENSHRWDLPEDQLTDRFGYRQSVRPIPTPERGISKWNSNTYIYDTGSGGFSEDDGAFFLLPYWMGRYHSLILEKN